MGTLFQHDHQHPTYDAEAKDHPDPWRQLEVFTFSGRQGINIRIGEIGDLNMGSGYSVTLDKAGAQQFFDDFETALVRFGWDR